MASRSSCLLDLDQCLEEAIEPVLWVACTFSPPIFPLCRLSLWCERVIGALRIFGDLKVWALCSLLQEKNGIISNRTEKISAHQGVGAKKEKDDHMV
jgi:hypothetical protein